MPYSKSQPSMLQPAWVPMHQAEMAQASGLILEDGAAGLQYGPLLA